MNQYEMVVLIIIAVMVASVIKARYKYIGDKQAPLDAPETARMRDEVRTLKERIAVLERIATDKESALDREIEKLRDR